MLFGHSMGHPSANCRHDPLSSDVWGDAVENRQLPAMLPGIARNSREPGLVGGRDEDENVSAFHAADCIIRRHLPQRSHATIL